MAIPICTAKERILDISADDIKTNPIAHPVSNDGEK